MPKKSNLLVSFDPSHLETAKKEVLDLLKEIKETGKILDIGEGIAEVSVSDSRKAIEKLEKIARKEIDKFKHTLHWTPIDVWCKNSIEDIKKKLKDFVKNIKPEERWKMELKTRKLKEKTDEVKLIVKLAEVIDRKKVDLENPEKIVKIEIIGNKAGLALLKPEELLNIAKLKQK